MNMQTLQANFDKLAQALNITQESVTMKDVQLASLLAENHNLTAEVIDYEILLNKSQVLINKCKIYIGSFMNFHFI